MLMQDCEVFATKYTFFVWVAPLKFAFHGLNITFLGPLKPAATVLRRIPREYRGLAFTEESRHLDQSTVKRAGVGGDVSKLKTHNAFALFAFVLFY